MFNIWNPKCLYQQGRLAEVPGVFRTMDQRGIAVDSSTYASLLKECSNKKALTEGKLVHAHIIHTGFNPDACLRTKLVIMYAKCGSLVDARRVLDEMPKRNVVSWTVMIAAYGRHGLYEAALTLFYQMESSGILPNQFTFASVLPACANLAALKHGKKVHEGIIRSGFQGDAVVERALVDMYIKCRSMECARKVFDKMSEPNVVTWTAMIAGYAQSGHVGEAVKFFQKMPERNVVSWNAMIAGYAQIGCVDETQKLFQKMPERNVISWTTMIALYAQKGCFKEALQLFQEMQLSDVKPDSVTFASVISACANLAALEHGKKVHEDIIRSEFQFDIFLQSALVDMYIKCGRMENARNVFVKMSERNVVSWTKMIAGYAQSGQVGEALKLFGQMPERDTVSWNAMITGCAQNGHVLDALTLFQKMPGRDMVSWNAIIAGYAQNGLVDKALKFFQEMPERDVVSWNVMIAAYGQNGNFNEALKFFGQMQLRGVKPDSITFASVLAACANLAALEYGKEVHEDIIRSGLQSDVFVGAALVDMYAKCGSIEKARHVFDKMPMRNVVSWNAIIGGYAMHGCGKDALQLFEEMQRFGMKPDHVTFVNVLSACCHAGLVDDGWKYFDCMSRDHHITPTVEHYCCMVDLLGRAGHLDEALNFINKMPMKPTAAVWGSLLGACRIHANIELGEHVAEHLFEMDPNNPARYVLLANIYAAAGKWDDVEMVRKMMKDKGLKKRPGCSWIDVNSKMYTFLVEDR